MYSISFYVLYINFFIVDALNLWIKKATENSQIESKSSQIVKFFHKQISFSNEKSYQKYVNHFYNVDSSKCRKMLHLYVLT